MSIITPIRNHKKLTTLIAGVLVILLIPATALAYVGFVPGLTEAMGINKPVDLGVQYTSADLSSLVSGNSLNLTFGNYDSSGLTQKNITDLSPGPDLIVSGPDSNTATFTQAELTALINKLPWTNSPLSNSQIRLSDGTVEFSGNVKSWYLADLVKSLYPNGNYGAMSPFLKLASHLDDPAIYAKMNVSVDDVSGAPGYGQLHLKMLALRINRIDLTSNVSKMNAINATVGAGSQQQSLAFSVGSLTVSDGQLQVYGTLPTHYDVGSGDPSVICADYHGGSLLSLNPIDGRIGSVAKSCPL